MSFNLINKYWRQDDYKLNQICWCFALNFFNEKLNSNPFCKQDIYFLTLATTWYIQNGNHVSKATWQCFSYVHNLYDKLGKNLH